jgi:hypothetical protein
MRGLLEGTAMTNLNRIATTGHSAAAIFSAGLSKPKDPSDPIHRALRRLHKREVLELCEQYSREKGLRLDKLVLP